MKNHLIIDPNIKYMFPDNTQKWKRIDPDPEYKVKCTKLNFWLSSPNLNYSIYQLLNDSEDRLCIDFEPLYSFTDSA